MVATDDHRPEIAFYYPGKIWRDSEWVKSLILFFDGIGLLIPDYFPNYPQQVDPVVAAGLEEHGLLHVIQPEKAVDQISTKALVEAMTNVITSGVLDSLSLSEEFEYLSYSRLGGLADRRLADLLLGELQARGLARATEDGTSIPMHPRVRSLILVFLSQLLRPYGTVLGAELSPITDRHDVIQALSDLLTHQGPESSAKVVSLDLSAVSVNLSSVPFDEILDFRKMYLSQHRAYMRSVRAAVRELSMCDPNESARMLDDRRGEINDLAADLRSRSRQAWRLPASLSFGILGAAWTLSNGDPLGALLGLGGTLLSQGASSNEAGAYSYLLRAQTVFR